MKGKILPIESEFPKTSVTAEQLFGNLSRIPDNTLQEYVAITKKQTTENCILLNIFSNIGNEILLRFLIDDLDQNKIDKFNRIALHLSVDNLTEKVGELAYLTFDSNEIDPKKVDIISHFIEKAKSLNIDFDQRTGFLLEISKDVQLACKIALILSQKIPGQEREIFKKLADLPEEDVNYLFKILVGMVIDKEIL